MSWWNNFRDDLETGVGLALNYFYPGTVELGHFVNSKGSQQQLFGTEWGQAAGLLGGLAGGYEGNMSNYGTAWNAMTGAGSAAGASGNVANLVDAYQTNLAGGMQPAQALQLSGLTPGQAEAAGIAAPGGDTWQNYSQQAGIPYGGGLSNQGMFGSTTSGSAASGGIGGPAAQTAKTAGAMPWGSTTSNMSIGSGIFGLLESQKMQQAALAAQQAADPFAQYRGYYGQQLMQLEKDPSSIFSSPGYAAGQQAIERSMAAQGYTGSGNMMAAMQKYGGDFYNQTLAETAQLAGSGANPAAAAQLGLQGQQYGVQLAGQSLGSLGYGGYMATNNPYSYQYPQQQAYNPYAIYQGGGQRVGG